jgi:hypothetical protein
LPEELKNSMTMDQDFDANSRRVRLEALANYCKSIIRFLDTGVIKQKVQITRIPDVSEIVTSHPRLEEVLSQRWIDAQKCWHQKCFLSSIILMGSILEGLLLARVSMEPSIAYQARTSPKEKNGSNKPYHEWNLSQLIDVACEIGWIKSDRGKFSHALRESRNIVHPWAQISANADFDEATCATSWEVLKAALDDLVKAK